MTRFLYEYNLHPTTWVYLSSLLILTVYFKFSPLLRLRNLDMLGLVAMAPGLVMLQEPGAQYVGIVWLFATGVFFLIRMLADPMMVRRPLLEPNLNTGGLTFLGVVLLVFLSMSMATAELSPGSKAGMLSLFGGLPAAVLPAVDAATDGPESIVANTTRAASVLAQVLLVLGLVLVGYRHFRNINSGIAVATLYLLMPGTALMSGRIDLMLPGALLVWMTLAYRSPLISGMLLGLAAGAIYYPLFLLPLWCGFYWQRGLFRFLGGCGASLLVLVGLSSLTPGGVAGFWQPLLAMFSLSTLDSAEGLWGLVFQPAYRLPVQVAFVAMCVGFALWPVAKNFGTLLSCSAAVMLGTQFWQIQAGGTSVGWYLPLLLLTVFRPNLEDRIALSVLGEGWLRRFRPRVRLWRGDQAA